VGDSDLGKGGMGKIVAIGGLCVSLIGNYLQFQKNKSDAQTAQQQIAVAQQQAKIAQDELALKQRGLDEDLLLRNRKTQNCNQLLAERDDALNVVHTYDQKITEYEAHLQSEKQQLAMAQTQHDDVGIAQHRSLSELAENAIQSMTASRDEAAARVRDIEQNCK
jgi:hypothetical protein